MTRLPAKRDRTFFAWQDPCGNIMWDTLAQGLPKFHYRSGLHWAYQTRSEVFKQMRSAIRRGYRVRQFELVPSK